MTAINGHSAHQPERKLQTVPLEYLTVEHLNTKELIRIFSKIEIHPDVSFDGTPCWIWCSTRVSDSGYGHLSYYNKAVIVHRFMFAWLIHALPKNCREYQIDHLCKRSSCCNPIHLDYVTARINTLRSNNPAAVNATKTHCIRNHEFTLTNTYIDKRGSRCCRSCRLAYERKHSKAIWQRRKQRQRLLPPRPRRGVLNNDSI